jgi:hypothetical protein
MMFEMRAFKAEDIYEITEQQSMRNITHAITTIESWERVARGPYAYTMLWNGKILCCTGVVQYWKDRGEVWSVIDQGCGPDLVYVTKAAKRFFDIVPIKRIEATVKCDFEEGHRWIKLLGFHLEAERLVNYFPDGSDVSLYARIKN